MTPKIDLRNRSNKEYPPEIAELVELYGGSPGKAEKAAGISIGQFSKIRSGTDKLTEFTKLRVRAAIEAGRNNGLPAQKKLTIPDACPPLIADLIRFKGSKTEAIKVLGTSDGGFYAVISGKNNMPPAWIVRAKAAMGQSVIGAPQEQEAATEADAPQVPEFVPWDGKVTTVKTKGAPGAPFTTRKGVAVPIAMLVERCGGAIGGAAKLAGHTAGWLLPLIEDPKNKFKEKPQKEIHNALHGIAPAFRASMGEDFDKYTLGLAIVMAGAANFDRIKDIADILNGRLVFKKSTKAGWLIIYKMATDDLAKFKRLALRDAHEIVCP